MNYDDRPLNVFQLTRRLIRQRQSRMAETSSATAQTARILCPLSQETISGVHAETYPSTSMHQSGY